MAAIFENFLKSCHMYFLDTLGVENFDEIALSLTVKEIEAFLCFRIFGENSKMAAIFENFAKSQHSIFLKYLGGRKFQRNSKWPPFFERQNFFQNWAEYVA